MTTLQKALLDHLPDSSAKIEGGAEPRQECSSSDDRIGLEVVYYPGVKMGDDSYSSFGSILLHLYRYVFCSTPWCGSGSRILVFGFILAGRDVAVHEAKKSVLNTGTGARPAITLCAKSMARFYPRFDYTCHSPPKKSRRRSLSQAQECPG